jgi:DNA polymerase III delta prime subunit
MNNIIVNEKLNLSTNTLKSIITYYNNDVRCMINYLQTNISKKVSVLENNYLYKLYIYNSSNQFNKFVNYINNIENKCNIDKFYILKQYVYFILKNIHTNINVEKIKNYEFCFHNFEYNENIVKYIYYLTIS